MRQIHWAMMLALALLTACATRGGTPVAGDQTLTPRTSGSSSAAASSSAAPAASATSAPSPPATSAPAAPTPTLIPTPASSSPAASPATLEREIVITEPQPGATINGSVAVAGSTNYWPFEATLVVQVKDAQGQVLGTTPVMVRAPDIGQGGPFMGEISFAAPTTAQAGMIEVFEASAKDGSIVARQAVPVQLEAAVAAGLQLDSPVANTDVTLPLHIAFADRSGSAQLGSTVTARLRFGNGVVLEQPVPVVQGADGARYGVGNMTWNTESQPPATPPGEASFELVGSDGSVLQRVPVRMLPEDQTTLVDVAWTTPEASDLIVFQQAVPRTPAIGSTALQELLNGPPDGNLAGAVSALPSTEEIVNFAGREPGWGYQVRLIKLVIADGVATANFSRELQAYGGGSARVQAIRQQIERTLRQFPSVREVVIQIEGASEGVLQP